MKSINIRKIVFLFFCILFLFLLQNEVFAGYQTLNNLDFEIYITEDGNMRVTETWDVHISETNTLYKTFPKDDSYSKIEDVSVIEISSNDESTQFSKIDKYMYHVDEDCFQALDNPDGYFEIAWGVNETGSNSRKFKISYTVLNNIVKYNDCAELYWKLIGNDFEIYSENVTGTVHLPFGIENIDDLKVWAHGPLNGTIKKDSTEKVSFNVNDLEGGNFLEIRIVMPTEIFAKSDKIVNENRFSEILEEETIYANEANERREQKDREEKIAKIVVTVFQTLFIIFMLTRINKNSRKLNRTPKQKPEQEFEYFRDIPDENATSGEAGFLYYFDKGGIPNYISKILSATMLNLSLKGYLEFQENSKKKKEIIIYLKDCNNIIEDEEEELYNFLKKVSENKNSFTMKDFERYSKKHVSKFNKLLEKITEIVEERCERKDLFDKELKKKYDNSIGAFAIYLSLGMIDTALVMFNIPLYITLVILIIINCIFIMMYANRVNGLTQNGINYKEKWDGLKKYMENFSMLDERSVPELVLWEKYLVYATAFGIADKVIKQLKVKFPELENEEYMRSNCVYMHMISNSNNNFNFINAIDSSIGSTTNYSSASGAGGGFSSGGGGGGRRWRRRWSLKLKIIENYIN